MKSKTFAILAVVAMVHFGCGNSEKSQDTAAQNQGTPIDSSVVGKDTSPVDTRKNIDKNDAQKQAIPGRDTTNTDEPR